MTGGSASVCVDGPLRERIGLDPPAMITSVPVQTPVVYRADSVVHFFVRPPKATHCRPPEDGQPP